MVAEGSRRPGDAGAHCSCLDRRIYVPCFTPFSSIILAYFVNTFSSPCLNSTGITWMAVYNHCTLVSRSYCIDAACPPSIQHSSYVSSSYAPIVQSAVTKSIILCSHIASLCVTLPTLHFVHVSSSSAVIPGQLWWWLLQEDPV